MIAVKSPETSPTELRSFNSWTWNIKCHGHGFYCPGVVLRWWLLVNRQGLELQNWIFSPSYSTSYLPTMPILAAKNWTLPHLLLLFPANISHVCNFFAPQGALNALQWRAFPENINLGKIGNILTLQLGYHGWF